MYHKFKEARESKGFTTKQVADYCKIPQSFVTDIENGTLNPSLENVVDLCRILDLDERVFTKWINGIFKEQHFNWNNKF